MVNSTSYLNLFGKVDEAAESQKFYEEALAKYPVTSKTSCDILEIMVASLQAEVDDITRQRSLGTTERVGARKIDGYSKRLVELNQSYTAGQCAAKKAQAESDATLDSNLQLLDKAGQVASKSSKAATYVLWGLLGIIVVVSGVIIFKSLRKK